MALNLIRCSNVIIIHWKSKFLPKCALFVSSVGICRFWHKPVFNTTLPNYRANNFFILNDEFRCYKEDYPSFALIIFVIETSFCKFDKRNDRQIEQKLKFNSILFLAQTTAFRFCSLFNH